MERGIGTVAIHGRRSADEAYFVVEKADDDAPVVVGDADGGGGGEDFPHWQIMTNRREGVTRRAVMRHEYYCAAVMDALGDAAASAGAGAGEGKGAASSTAGDNTAAVGCEWNYPSIVRLSSTSSAVPSPRDAGERALATTASSASGAEGEEGVEGDADVAVVGGVATSSGSLGGAALKWWSQSIAELFWEESGLNISDAVAVGAALAALRDTSLDDTTSAAGRPPSPPLPPPSSPQLFSAQQLSALRRLLETIYVPPTAPQRLEPRNFYAIVTAVYEYSYYHSADLGVANVLWRGDGALSSAEAVYAEALVGRPRVGPIAGGWLRRRRASGDHRHNAVNTSSAFASTTPASTTPASSLPHHYRGAEAAFAAAFGHVPTRAERGDMHSTLRGMSGGGEGGGGGGADMSSGGGIAGAPLRNGIPFTALPLRVPSPSVLAALAPSSPLVYHLQLHETINLFGDDLPRAAAAAAAASGSGVGVDRASLTKAIHSFGAVPPPRVMNVRTSSQWAEVVASQKKADGASAAGPPPLMTLLMPPTADKDMHSRYTALAGDVEAVRRGFGGGGGGSFPRPSTSSFSPPRRPLYTDGKIPSISDNFRSQQYVVAVRDRLVRLGPTLTPHYQSAIREGMLSVQRDRIAHAAAGKGKQRDQQQRQHQMNAVDGVGAPSPSSPARPPPPPPLLGLLSDAPLSVRASLADALSGTWNVSALPPWLVVPSAVSTRECFGRSPPAAPFSSSFGSPSSPSASSSSASSSLFGAEGGASSHNNSGGGSRRRSLLILGPSYARNLYSKLCMMHAGTMAAATHHWQRSRDGKANSSSSSMGKKAMVAADVNALCRLTNGHQVGYQMLHRSDVSDPDDDDDDGTSSSDQPLVVGYSWFTVDTWESFDRLITNLFKELARYTPPNQRTDATTEPPLPLLRPNIPHRSIEGEMLKYYPHFTQRAFADGEEGGGTADDPMVSNHSRAKDGAPSHHPKAHQPPQPRHRRTFRYSDFIARYRRSDMGRLKGLFTHVLFMPGAWQKAHGDTTMPEQTEANAMTIDLIAELLAPTEKIIVSTGYNWFSTQQQDAAGDSFHSDFFAPKSAGGGSGGVSGCSHKFREHKFRDAVVCGTSVGARRRVRQSAADHLGGLMRSGGAPYAMDVVGGGDAEAAADDDGSVRATAPNNPNGKRSLPSSLAIPVEVFDPFPRLSAPFAYLDMCLAGNHPLSHVLEALLQTLLREHVCPPRYVMAVPEGDPSLHVGGGGGASSDHHHYRHLTSTATPYASSGHGAAVPLVNYARSGLPAVFPDFANTKRTQGTTAGMNRRRTLIKVRQTPQSHRNMPSLLWDERDGSYTIVDLFPLTKVPLAEVAEGVCRAIFDSPGAELSAVTRVVRRRREYGVGAGEGATGRLPLGREGGHELAWATYPNHSSFPSPSSEAAAQSRPLPFFPASPVGTYFPLNDGDGYAFANMSIGSRGSANGSSTSPAQRPFSPSSPSPRFLGSFWLFNPFVVCTQCMPLRSRRFYVPSEAAAAQAALEGFVSEVERRRRLTFVNESNESGSRSSSDGIDDDAALLRLVQQPFPISLTDPASAAISHPLHPSTAHSCDPLYMLRTLPAVEGGRCTCQASRYVRDPSTPRGHKGGSGKRGKGKKGGGRTAADVACSISAQYPGLPFPFDATGPMARATLGGTCGPAPMEELMARMAVWAYLARGIGREGGRPM